MRKRKGLSMALVGLCLALALAACQPGGSASGSAGPASTPAPIHVSTGYQGLVLVTFTSSASYDQAAAVLQSAGMRLQAQCPHPGPIRVGTPTPVTQQGAFAATRQLTAIGVPHLTQAMLDKVAASAQVTLIEQAPQVECPLTP
jgi:hypothetical protein